ncbi:cytosolic acyl coenzyme A thioester hydrolase [Mugil cephalus]|uniref:cytosolic acyl coenzyme A thioester hydrolase n=1 Tax=Mugil cephalus TaxID=48193 RepID=UPI001FB5E376|nr:cytosolic acyl coenzyme A thioester hydrolase [Mugil cephalus]
MSPNMNCEAVQSFSPKLTVAKRKEALELRKTMKPLMEKRRRARINDSLNHLKSLILPLTGRDNNRYSKLEKADILEMTVRFLSDIPPINTKNSADSYREGYKACLQRVSSMLPKTSLDQDACQRVNAYVQQSMSSTVPPACLNCCAQSSRTFPEIQQRLQSLKSSFGSRMESKSRIIKAEEGNSSGNAHGGSVLKLIEEAGIIASMRHCNSQNRERCFPALAQMEKVDFLSPLSVGEIIHTTAEITYASKHSLEVQVQVVAENPITGAKRMANKASLWYVPCSLQNLGKVMEVPPIEYVAEQEAEGRRRYEAQKMKRLEAKPRIEKTVPAPFNPEPYTVGFSQSLLIQYLCYPECIAHGYMDSGVMMRAMDEVAGLVLYNHCLKKGNPVTISVRDFNFNQKLKRGSILTVMGRATFTSARSMEIEVIADSMPLSDGITYRCASAFFSYVIWDNGSVPLPPLKIEGEDEQRRFEEGKAHYLQQKAMRSAEK